MTHSYIPSTGNRRIVVGVAVSLAVHALLVLAYRHASLVAPLPAPDAALTIAVTIAPPPPAPAPSARVAPAPAPVEQAAARTARRTPQARTQTATPAVIAVPDSTPAAPDTFAVQQPAPPPADAAPAFDMNAARQVARANANLRDPAREGTALAQFAEPPLQTESKLSRSIGAAKRGDCKDGIPGGLLAPIYLLMEKKDSGCKW